MTSGLKSDSVFVYGTLMRGYDHPMAKLLSRHADFLGEARCQGRLYMIKHYPGLTLSDDPDEMVYGELYRMRVPAEVLGELDMYESCSEDFPEPKEYLRQIRPVTSQDGAVSEVWTYIYNWPVDENKRIVSGRFPTK